MQWIFGDLCSILEKCLSFIRFFDSLRPAGRSGMKNSRILCYAVYKVTAKAAK